MRLLFVARSAPHKGLSDLVEALRSLSRADWQLTIVGAVAEEDARAVAEAARDFGPRIASVGPQALNQIAAIMRQHDVLIVPSRYENFCNVALEGLACGLPVIGVAVGGVRDMVSQEVNGLLFRPRDIGAMASTISWALDHPVEIRAMSFAARQTAKRYGWPLITDLTHEALLSVLWARNRGDP
jgi:glycosyltransferase involved in cell wall biosynthesis